MNSIKYDENKQKNEQSRQENVFPKELLLLLTFFGISASLTGFTIIFSIIISLRTYHVVMNPHGLIVGILLLGGGMTLLISLIFIKHSSSISSPSKSLVINQNELNS